MFGNYAFWKRFGQDRELLLLENVIPAKAGIQQPVTVTAKDALDSRFRGNDGSYLQISDAFSVPAVHNVHCILKSGAEHRTRNSC
jgi:hypothetical protein